MTTRRGHRITLIATALLALLPATAIAGEIVPIRSLVALPGTAASIPPGRDVTIEGTLSLATIPVGERACLGYIQDETAAIVLYSPELMLCGRFRAGERVQVQGQLALYQGGEEIRVSSASSIGFGTVPQAKDVLIQEVAEGKLFVRRVRLEGQLVVPHDFMAHGAWLSDRSGRIRVFPREELFRDRAF